MVLPNAADKQNIMHNFTLLVARQLCDHLKYFRENYHDVVPKHIEHQYYEEMCKKSHIVSIIKITVMSNFQIQVDGNS